MSLAHGASRLRFHIVQDYKENPRKCTARPLALLQDIRLLRLRRPVAGERRVVVPGGIWLDVEGPLLEAEDRGVLGSAGAEVVLFDATWARVDVLERRVVAADGAPVLRRSLPGDLSTAYPRRSKVHADPSGGLATVEALFAASVILGEPRVDVLASYRWSERFLAGNRDVLRRFGWTASGTSTPRRVRDATPSPR